MRKLPVNLTRAALGLAILVTLTGGSCASKSSKTTGGGNQQPPGPQFGNQTGGATTPAGPVIPGQTAGASLNCLGQPHLLRCSDPLQPPSMATG